MKPEEVSDFAEIIEIYRKTNYEKQQGPLSADAITVFAAVLQNYSLKRVEEAIRCHIADPTRCRWFPKAGDLIHQLRLTAARPEREVRRAIPAPPHPDTGARLKELTAEATDRYRQILEQPGKMADRQRAVTNQWKEDMRRIDPEWGRGR